MPGVILGKSFHTDKAFSCSYEMEWTMSAAGLVRETWVLLSGALAQHIISALLTFQQHSLSLGMCVGAGMHIS